MLARSRTVRLKTGLTFDSPLLVPGLSSMALGPVPIESDTAPGQAPELRPSSVIHSVDHITGDNEAFLISAYDIKHDFLTASDELRVGFTRSYFSLPRFLIIDSGWYEKDMGPAGGPFVDGLYSIQSWEKNHYCDTIDSLDKDIRAIVVSWDFRGSYDEQVARAQGFFATRSRFGSTLLLKPPSDFRFHDFSRLSDECCSNLRVFDVIGVTEKELGGTLLDRFVRLARLRIKMDANDVKSPIHVFGGLDPLFTPLYFAAGGEIFDGLSWLRYYFYDGLPINRDAAALLRDHIFERTVNAQKALRNDNLASIRQLASKMRVFEHRGGDWSQYNHGELLRNIFLRVEERVRRPNG